MRSLTHSSAGVIPHGLLGVPLTSQHVPPAIMHPQPTPQPLTGHIFIHNTPSFFNINGNDNSLLLSAQAKEHVKHAIQNGWAHDTVKRYSGTIKQFIRFCDAERVPQHLRFPADEFVLCAFAASSFGRHAGGTPRARLSALKAWHVAHNVEWKGSPRLRYVFNGVHNVAPRTTRRPIRPPINVKMLSQLVQNLNPDTPLDAAVTACATTAFWGQCRLGELLPSSKKSSLSTPLPTRTDFKRSIRNP
jgi:hypothetical protein